jgi:hypothetical protein
MEAFLLFGLGLIVSLVTATLSVVVTASRFLAELRRGRGAGASQTLAQDATALGASGGGSLLFDGAYAFQVGGKTLRLFGANRRKSVHRFVCLAAEASAGGASGSPFRGGARRSIERLPRVVFRERGLATSLGRVLGLNVKIKTGDTEFDAGVCVESDGGDEELGAILSDERVRRGVVALLAAGCFEVALADRGYAVVAAWPRARPLSGEAESLRAAAQHVIDVVEGLPMARSAELPRGPRRYWLEVATSGLALAAFAALDPADRAWRIIGDLNPTIAGGALSFTALLLGGTYAYARRRPDALMRFAIAAPAVTFFAPAAALVALHVANGWRDDTSVEYVADVVVDEIHSSKGPRVYRELYAVIPPRPPAEAATRVPIHYKLPEGVETPRRAVVRLGRGRLGYEWLRAIDLKLQRHQPGPRGARAGAARMR